jgi:NAD(P)-dependent dehydrogenase (short-subunit alcohol dehydrogenase family)
MKTFENRNVYVTGGSSGIGLATARLLAAEGANLLILSRSRDRIDRAVEEIEAERKSESQRISGMQLDVSRHEEVNRVIAKAVERFGVPDLLINNAGKAVPRPFEEISYEQLDDIMRTNFYGAWSTIQALLPHMKKKSGGHIVNVSSMAGFIGVFGYADYSASKFAMMGLSETLRMELKRYGIRVSVVCPPDTDTPGYELENRTKPPETWAIGETAKLVEPEVVARALIEGVRKERNLIMANAEGWLVYRAKRYVPFLLDWMLDRAVGKAQAQERHPRGRDRH